MSGPNSIDAAYLGTGQEFDVYTSIAADVELGVPCRFILVLTTGDVVINKPNGTPVTFSGVAAGTYLIFSTDTIKAATTADVAVGF